MMQAQEQMTRAEQRRQRLLEIEKEQRMEEAEAIKMTEEQRQTLLHSFRSVKIEFSDLDGLRWTPAALKMLQPYRPHAYSSKPAASQEHNHAFVVLTNADLAALKPDDTIRVSSGRPRFVHSNSQPHLHRGAGGENRVALSPPVKEERPFIHFPGDANGDRSEHSPRGRVRRSLGPRGVSAPPGAFPTLSSHSSCETYRDFDASVPSTPTLTTRALEPEIVSIPPTPTPHAQPLSFVDPTPPTPTSCMPSTYISYTDPTSSPRAGATLTSHAPSSLMQIRTTSSTSSSSFVLSSTHHHPPPLALPSWPCISTTLVVPSNAPPRGPPGLYPLDTGSITHHISFVEKLPRATPPPGLHPLNIHTPSANDVPRPKIHLTTPLLLNTDPFALNAPMDMDVDTPMPSPLPSPVETPVPTPLASPVDTPMPSPVKLHPPVFGFGYGNASVHGEESLL